MPCFPTITSLQAAGAPAHDAPQQYSDISDEKEIKNVKEKIVRVREIENEKECERKRVPESK